MERVKADVSTTWMETNSKFNMNGRRWGGMWHVGGTEDNHENLTTTAGLPITSLIQSWNGVTFDEFIV
jgi:hypothetical protein